MSDVILIKPTRCELTGGVTGLEIRLGGTPRGLVVLLSDTEVPEAEVVAAMNRWAIEGYESLALTAAGDPTATALARASERGWAPEQIGVVGIGAGGTVALDLARRHQVGAVVSVSAAPRADEVASDPFLRTPWLGLFGEHADDITAAERRRIEHALRDGSDVYSQVVVYPGVGSDFYRRSEDGISFAASYDGWQRATEWLNARVAARLTPLALAWRARRAG